MRIVRVALLAAALAAVAAPSAAAFGVIEDRLPDGVVGSAYSFQLRAEKGCPPYTFSVTAGGLPPGLSLTSSGVISGTPTAAGSWGFWIDGKDSCSAHSQRPFGLNVIPKLTVTTNSLSTVTVGAPVSVTLTAEGGGSLAWSVSQGSLPAGLTLTAGGSLTGSPTTVGSTTFTVLVSDGQRSDTKVLTLTVVAPLVATSPAQPAAEVGRLFSARPPAATGGSSPYAWSVAGGTLPAGLTVNPGSGAIGGTPVAAGSFPLKLTVTDANGASATVDVALAIAPRLTIATKRLAPAKARRPYRATLAAHGGIRPVSWRLVGGTLPRGIRLDGRSGVLVGTAHLPARSRITVEAVDALRSFAKQTFVLLVRR